MRRTSANPTRRSVVGGIGLGIAAAWSGAAAQAQAARKTFVLIHGAYHGGWCWRKVVDILEKQGHKVYAPSLTGLADRSHLLSMNLTLDTHITDIVNLFKWEDITNGCLAVHSAWRLAGLGRARADRRPRFVDRLGRRVHTEERRESSWTRSRPSAARRWKRPWPRARPAASRRRRASTHSARRTTPGWTPSSRRSRTRSSATPSS